MDWAEVWEIIQARDRELHERFYNTGYQNGTYLKTNCGEASISSYDRMNDKLKELRSTYSGVEIIPVGKSMGYRGYENALPIVSFHILPTDTEQTNVYFVAGLHPEEWSGSETVYLIAERLLDSYRRGNANVQELRKNTRLIFVPQLSPDIYYNLAAALKRTRGEFYIQAYSYLSILKRLANIDRKQIEEILANQEPNWFGDMWSAKNMSFKDALYRHLSPVLSMEGDSLREYIETKYRNRIKPVLAFDYHETPNISDDLDDSSEYDDDYHEAGLESDWPFYITWDGTSGQELAEYGMIEVLKAYVPDLNLASVDRRFRRKSREQSEDEDTFRDYMGSLGAQSFCLENASVEQYALHDRVQMNLIATDRILARHFLGI